MGFSLPFGITFLDIIILIVFLFYIYEGYAVGFFNAFFDLLSFVLSFSLGLFFYSFIASFLYSYFSIPIGFSNIIGFFVIAFVFEIVFTLLFRRVSKRISKALIEASESSTRSTDGFIMANRIFGIIPGFLSAFVLLAFLLTVISSLPFSPFLKNAIFSSKLGNILVVNASSFDKKLNDVFGGAVKETLTFLTIEPKSDEIVKLNFTTTSFTTDTRSEREMFELVNKERARVGLPPFDFDELLSEVARDHSSDMLTRGYFSHYTPEGLTPFDRMTQADVLYSAAGENLALAPTTELAMQGLMNSPGHRANILSTDFGKIGIGVMDAGIYGKMFTQEFTN